MKKINFPHVSSGRACFLFFFFALCMSSGTLEAQDTTVSGTITDITDNNQLPGVNVVVKGTLIGVASDANGKYSITLTEGQNVLVFSFIGFTDAEVRIDGRDIVDVQMIPSMESLMEVVIVGSRNQNRTELDAAVPIDIINISQIAAQTGKVEINQMLQYASPSAKLSLEKAYASVSLKFLPPKAYRIVLSSIGMAELIMKLKPSTPALPYPFRQVHEGLNVLSLVMYSVVKFANPPLLPSLAP